MGLDDKTVSIMSSFLGQKEKKYLEDKKQNPLSQELVSLTVAFVRVLCLSFSREIQEESKSPVVLGTSCLQVEKRVIFPDSL
jgi:hypothetical protein